MQSHSSPVTEFPVPSLRRTDAIALIRHLGRGDRDLKTARPEALDPMLAVTEGNPFLIKLVIRHYLATHRSLQLVISELIELRRKVKAPAQVLVTRSVIISTLGRSISLPIGSAPSPRI